MTNKEKIKIFKGLFKGRTNAYVLFDPKTKNYIKKDGMVNDKLIEDHITSKKFIAIYPINQGENTCLFGVLDLDIKDYGLVESLLMSFRYLKIPVYLEKSKSKGFHFHVFFEKPILASKIRRLLEIIKTCSLANNKDKAEIFPKQDSVNKDGYGNPILLPFNGIVSKPFLDPNNDFKSFKHQWSLLQSAKKIKEKQIDEILEKNEEKQPEILDLKIEPEIDFDFMTTSEIFDLDIQTKWIIDSLVPTDGLSMLVGQAKHFKTWILLEMARCVARGDKFLNKFQTNKGKVVYIDEENGLAMNREIKKRDRKNRSSFNHY